MEFMAQIGYFGTPDPWACCLQGFISLMMIGWLGLNLKKPKKSDDPAENRLCAPVRPGEGSFLQWAFAKMENRPPSVSIGLEMRQISPVFSLSRFGHLRHGLLNKKEQPRAAVLHKYY